MHLWFGHAIAFEFVVHLIFQFSKASSLLSVLCNTALKKKIVGGKNFNNFLQTFLLLQRVRPRCLLPGFYICRYMYSYTCTNIYINTLTCINTYMYIYIYIYVSTYIYSYYIWCMYIHLCTYICIHIYKYINVYIYTYIHTHIYTYTFFSPSSSVPTVCCLAVSSCSCFVYIYIYIHIHICMYISIYHIHIYTYIYTHTCKDIYICEYLHFWTPLSFPPPPSSAPFRAHMNIYKFVIGFETYVHIYMC